MERATGFEPATTWLEARRTTKLCFTRSGCLLHPAIERAKPMAVRTDDIALVYLGQYPVDPWLAIIAGTRFSF